MARTRAMSPTPRALPQRSRRPSTLVASGEYATASSTPQTPKAPAKTTHSASKTVKRRSGLADDRASTATGGNAAMRAKVLAAVVRLSRERGTGKKGVGHNSIRKYVLDHGADARANGFSSTLLRSKHALIEQGVLIHALSAGNTLAPGVGVSQSVQELCDVSNPDSDDDELACSTFLSSKKPKKGSAKPRKSGTPSTAPRVVKKTTVRSTSKKRPAKRAPQPSSTPTHSRVARKGKVVALKGEADSEVDELLSDSDTEHKLKPGVAASKLTKAQLVVELEKLRKQEQKRADEVDDLREKLEEMSEVNQTWEARARVLGYRDEEEEEDVAEEEGDVEVAMADDEHGAAEAQEDEQMHEDEVGVVEGEEDAGPAAEVGAEGEVDVRVEEQDGTAAVDEAAPVAVSPTVEEPDTEAEEDLRDLGDVEQPFIADNLAFEAELQRAWPDEAGGIEPAQLQLQPPEPQAGPSTGAAFAVGAPGSPPHPQASTSQLAEPLAPAPMPPASSSAARAATPLAGPPTSSTAHEAENTPPAAASGSGILVSPAKSGSAGKSSTSSTKWRQHAFTLEIEVGQRRSSPKNGKAPGSGLAQEKAVASPS